MMHQARRLVSIGRDIRNERWVKLVGNLYCWLAGDDQPDDWRKTREYDVWRESVLDRDNRTCQDCGATHTGATLHAHHLTPVSQGGAKFDTDNGVTVCESCHANRHKGDGTGVYRLLEHNARRN